MSDRIDFLNLYAQRKHSAPAGWGWVRWKRLGKAPAFDGGMMVRGAACPPRTRGAGKGLPNWSRRDRSTELMFTLSQEAFDAFLREWERETGLCSHCEGSGQEWEGWSAVNGNRYRPCSKCAATGKSQFVEAAE